MPDSWSEWKVYSYIALEKNTASSAKWLEWLAGQLRRRLTRAIVIAISTLSTLLLLRTFYIQELRMPETFESSLKTLQTNDTIHTGYSVKPIAYVFPQYYPFPENDKLWGTNFTEWNNVRSVKHNGYGLETLRPHESIGYYNGLDFSTRQRQAAFIKDIGFYGLAYHHYWFAGKPVMDHILQAMLKDGEPNTPFMLSWANEPWTANWDGNDASRVLIAQDYGNIQDWRKHFDWLLTFFRHPLYIRSNGKIQFIVYKSGHMGPVGSYMFAAWRQWTIDEGLGGMDIIETRYGDGTSSPDAVNEFSPHAAGMHHERHPLTTRNTRVYHRGTNVCWDSTPRHAHDGAGLPDPTCTPERWKVHLLKMLRKIKQEPNPRGSENFFFVNALNEWGGGNTFEPSVQFGYRYAQATKDAFVFLKEPDVWRDEEFQEGLKRMQSPLSLQEIAQLDVCVLVRTGSQHGDDRIFTLDTTLRSLQAQNNRNWKALVFEEKGDKLDSLKPMIIRLFDPRIIEADITKTISVGDKAWETKETNSMLGWLTKNLEQFDVDCAGAKYLLITDGGNEYKPHAFDVLPTSLTDLFGLNSESAWTSWDEDRLRNGADQSHENDCLRFEDTTTILSKPSIPQPLDFDLAATFIYLPRFLASGQTISPPPTDSRDKEGGELVASLIHDYGWTWASSQGSQVHVLHNPSFTGCQERGMMWLDSEKFEECGCYSTEDLQGKFGGGLEELDLQRYREEGRGICMRKKNKRRSGMGIEGDKSADVSTGEASVEVIEGFGTKELHVVSGEVTGDGGSGEVTDLEAKEVSDSIQNFPPRT